MLGKNKVGEKIVAELSALQGLTGDWAQLKVRMRPSLEVLNFEFAKHRPSYNRMYAKSDRPS